MLSCYLYELKYDLNNDRNVLASYGDAPSVLDLLFGDWATLAPGASWFNTF